MPLASSALLLALVLHAEQLALLAPVFLHALHAILVQPPILEFATVRLEHTLLLQTPHAPLAPQLDVQPA